MAIEVPSQDSSPKTCAVLGGRSFIGRSLVFRLLKLGNWIVRVADSAHSLDLDLTDSADYFLDQAISSRRASYHPLHILDKSAIAKAIEGSSVVFYIGDTDLWNHDIYQSYQIIVQGAKNVINACRECKVGKLIFNSSADVIFDGSHDINNGDESLRCHFRFKDQLNDLKAHAEELVLFANNMDSLLTCALRPSNVFGPGETQFLPFFWSLAKSGCAKCIIGGGENMSDFTFVENVAHAHICAAEALESQIISVAGKAFFITNLEPVKFWEFLSQLLEGLGFQRPFIKLPARVVWYLLLFVKWMREKLGFRRYNHSMSAYFFRLATHTRTFNCSAAQKYIGYSPVVSLDDGLALTIESFSELTKHPAFSRYSNIQESSKVHNLLASGKVADILLWRDEKRTFTYFLTCVILYYWFLLSGRTFASSAAKLLLLMAAVLYGYGLLPQKTSRFTIQRPPLSWFEISETSVKDSVKTIAYMWNSGFHKIQLLAQGKDWIEFFKVGVVLYLVKFTLLHSFTVVVGAALVFSFSAFFVYEQYELEIDELVKLTLSRIMEFKLLLTRKLPAPAASFLQNDGLQHKLR